MIDPLAAAALRAAIEGRDAETVAAWAGDRVAVLLADGDLSAVAALAGVDAAAVRAWLRGERAALLRELAEMLAPAAGEWRQAQALHGFERATREARRRVARGAIEPASRGPQFVALLLAQRFGPLPQSPRRMWDALRSGGADGDRHAASVERALGCDHTTDKGKPA